MQDTCTTLTPQLHNLVATTTQGYVRLSDGGKYKGELLGMVPHGMGTCIFANGDRYKGQWCKGQRHGIGTLHTAEGFQYIHGEWREGVACGQGVVAVYKEVGTYTGDFHNNQRCGWGVLELLDGSRVEGEWAHDTIHGQAVFTHADQSVFVGTFAHGQRVYGTLTMGGSRWQGNFVEGVLQGTGCHCIVEGQYEYTGGFVRGLREGSQGRCVYADGSVYEGGWVQDKRVGCGVLCGVPDGGAWERYAGEWVDDAPHGQGTITYHDGSTYEGALQHGLADGWGVQTDVDGTMVRGLWSKGVRQRGNVAPVLTRWHLSQGLYYAVAGQPTMVEFQLRDALCNAVDDAHVVVRLMDAHGSAFYAHHVQYNSGGWYAATYTLQRAGQYQMNVLVDGMAICAPGHVVVVAGRCDTTRSHVEVEEGGGAEVAWRMVLHDAYGNIVEDALDDDVQVQAMSQGTVLDVWMVAPCQYQCTLPEAGLCTIDVLVDGARVRGCPVGVDRRRTRCADEPVQDVVARWAAICTAEGGEEDAEDSTSACVPPDVPVIQDLADLWLLPRLLAGSK